MSYKRSLASVAVEFGVGKSIVHDIVKSQEKLKAFQVEVHEYESLKKRKIVRRADFEQLDKTMYLWLIQQRCKGEQFFLCFLIFR